MRRGNRPVITLATIYSLRSGNYVVTVTNAGFETAALPEVQLDGKQELHYGRSAHGRFAVAGRGGDYVERRGLVADGGLYDRKCD
jgi:hypothetical protein